MCANKCRHPQRPEEAPGSLGAGAGYCELSDMVSARAESTLSTTSLQPAGFHLYFYDVVFPGLGY